MFCNQCGARLPDGSKFCSECGVSLAGIYVPDVSKPVAEPSPETAGQSEPASHTAAIAPVTVDRQAQGNAPAAAKENVPTVKPVTIMVLGIVSLALAIGTGIGGIICYFITKNKVKQFVDGGGELTGKAGIGNTLSKVALPVGIVVCVLYVLYFIVQIVLSIAGVLLYGAKTVLSFDSILERLQSIFETLEELFD